MSTLEISSSEAAPHLVDADAVVIAVVKEDAGPRPGPGAKGVDDALGGTLAATLATLGATGELGEITKIPTAGRLTAPLLIAVGIGQPASGPDAPVDPDPLRRATGAAVRELATSHRRTGNGEWRIALALPTREAAEAEAVALGALLGGYSFNRYRPAPAGRTTLALLAANAHAAEALRRAQILATAVNLVRDLVNTSPSDLVPATFAERAVLVAADAGFEVSVLDEEALAEGGYGGILGVGKGSVHPPRLVRLDYNPPAAEKVLVLAGKGITFDSGGLSLKPAKAMPAMKSDMGGAAAVLGAMQAIAALRLPVHVVGYLPLAENMPSGSAQRPSDVLTIFGGTTVEVTNTDAEGRLVLADTLVRSRADSPDVLIDIATLTGAQVVALGPRVSGVMSNDDHLREQVVDASRRAGESMWPMPLPPDLSKVIESDIADVINLAAERDAGMLVAGLFLSKFVPSGVRWAHLDIAGPAFNSGEPHGFTPKGGTGAATLSLVQVAQDMADGRI
ncbi:MAG TPA: leucyl aminopeptidase [Streptosporangiaceae bacterium]|nr:leucyl aminopeptidase [Streptosporangiaceae bacterium]